MEFLRRVTEQIGKQLKDLSSSQRLVIFLMIALMAVGLYLLSDWVGQREMMALLNQDFTQEQMGRVVDKLGSWEEPFEQKGDRVWVLKSRRNEILSKLYFAEVLPEDTSVGFTSLLEGKSDIWMPESERQNRKQIILQMELARTISDFPGVDKAQVFINAGSRRTLSNVVPMATASVTVSTLGGGSVSSRKLASSIASTVSGAVNHLKREHVKVVIDGTVVPVVEEGKDLSSGYIEQQAAWEQHYRRKILDVLPPGVNALVQVDVKLQNTTRTKQSKNYSEEGQGTLVAALETDSREDTSSRQESQEEPGVIANASQPGGQNAAGTTQQQATEEASRKNTVYPGYTELQESTPPGGVTVEDRTAVVSVPVQYFQEIARQKMGEGQEPSQADIDSVKSQEIVVFKEKVLRALGLSGTEYEGNVVVDSYWAAGTASAVQAAGLAGAGESGSSLSTITRQYGKHVAISALAMISLFMVLMMVRKAMPSGQNESQILAGGMVKGRTPLDVLGPDEANLSDGDDSEGLLAGMEVDGHAVRSQQVLEQIREMVGESPDIAANLLAKWIKQNS